MRHDELNWLKDFALEVESTHDKFWAGVREFADSVPVSPGERPYMTEIKAILDKRIGEIEEGYLSKTTSPAVDDGNKRAPRRLEYALTYPFPPLEDYTDAHTRSVLRRVDDAILTDNLDAYNEPDDHELLDVLLLAAVKAETEAVVAEHGEQSRDALVGLIHRAAMARGRMFFPPGLDDDDVIAEYISAFDKEEQAAREEWGEIEYPAHDWRAFLSRRLAAVLPPLAGLIEAGNLK